MPIVNVATPHFQRAYKDLLKDTMSLRSRKFFDVLQHHPNSILNSSRFRLPIPPYHTSDYWDRLYKNLDSEDVHEWGGFDLQSGLLKFQYERLLHYKDGLITTIQNNTKEDKEEESSEVQTSTFAECMDINQFSSVDQAIHRYEENHTKDMNESILLLGCGNSKVGEQLLRNSFVGPVLQMDVSSKMIQLMTKRYEKYLSEASITRIEFIVDDANNLTSLSPNSVGGGVVDKGLIDVLHSSTGMIDNEDVDNPIRQIMESVHRVIKPSRPFMFFSRSHPEYIFRRALGTVQLELDLEIQTKWNDIQVLKLVDLDVLLYRFVKAEPFVQRKRRRIESNKERN